jgi:hypothetical protein
VQHRLRRCWRTVLGQMTAPSASPIFVFGGHSRPRAGQFVPGELPHMTHLRHAAMPGLAEADLQPTKSSYQRPSGVRMPNQLSRTCW